MEERMKSLRKSMGTLAYNNSEPPKTKFYQGVEGIKVQLADHSTNPYKEIFIIATSTWGNKINKWEDVDPENRFKVVISALAGLTLPTALEAPQFLFTFEESSRAAFDQIARARIGAGFGARGVRDNNFKDAGFRIPNAFEDNTEAKRAIKRHCIAMKKLYVKLLGQDRSSWQAARSVLPMNICYGYSMTINYLALKGLCSKRLKFCEQEDTVATAWLMRSALKEKFPLLASFLRPGCDWGRQCQYQRSYYLSDLFGCLFSPCRRHERNKFSEKNGKSEFNLACSSREIIQAQLGIYIPKGDEQLPDINTMSIDELKPEEKILFYQR